MTARDLKDMMDAGENIYAADVREPNEYEIVSIPGATLIPRRVHLGAALEKLPQDKRIGCTARRGAQRRGAGHL